MKVIHSRDISIDPFSCNTVSCFMPYSLHLVRQRNDRNTNAAENRARTSNHFIQKDGRHTYSRRDGADQAETS